jgi:hypothetical protein
MRQWRFPFRSLLGRTLTPPPVSSSLGREDEDRHLQDNLAVGWHNAVSDLREEESSVALQWYEHVLSSLLLRPMLERDPTEEGSGTRVGCWVAGVARPDRGRLAALSLWGAVYSWCQSEVSPLWGRAATPKRSGDPAP